LTMAHNDIYPTPDPEALRAALVRCMLKARQDAQLDAPALATSVGDDQTRRPTPSDGIISLAASSDVPSNGRAIRTVVRSGSPGD
jgi:hypothetical protein